MRWRMALACLAVSAVASADEGGAIVGRVTLVGGAPSPEAIEITKDRGADDTEKCGISEKRSPEIRIGPDGGVANAVVELRDVDATVPLGTGGTPLLDQLRCEFVPHVLLAPVGSTVHLRNSDGILHNVHSYSRANPPFNRAQPKFRKILETTFRKPERVRVTCDAHPWMSAWIVVHDHPWIAVTDEAGSFRIEGVPPGEHRLAVWHETLGEGEAAVSVPAGGEAETLFELAAP